MSQKMLDGVLDIDDMWAILYGKDTDDAWDSDIALIKANPNYNISVSGEFLQARQRDAKTSARKQSVFRTKHLNEWVGAKNAWLNIAKWQNTPARKSLHELENRPDIAEYLAESQSDDFLQKGKDIELS